MAADKTWGLRAELVDAIDRTFCNRACIYRCLGTNNKIWDKKILMAEGVKQNTARDLVLGFFRKLKNAVDRVGADYAEDLNLDVAAYFYDRYADDIREGMDVSRLICRVDAPGAYRPPN